MNKKTDLNSRGLLSHVVYANFHQLHITVGSMALMLISYLKRAKHRRTTPIIPHFREIYSNFFRLRIA